MIREVSVIKATGGNGRIDLVLWQTGECWKLSLRICILRVVRS